MFEIHLCHLKYIAGIGKKHIPPFSVFSHILVFTFLESFQLRRFVTFHPASLIQVYRLPTAGCIVFIQQTILNNLELQLSYRTDNLTSVELVDKKLGHSFIHQLVYAFG